MAAVWRAYVDESESDRQVDPDTYLLAAALVEDGHVDAVRERITPLKPAGHTKLHWHSESHLSRKTIVAAIAQLPALHVVVVRTGLPGEPSERRRRKCFERLAHELGGRDVAHITAEGRERKTNAREIVYFNRLRAAGLVPAAMRLDHLPGPREPLLWIPDAVAGALTAARTGTTDYFAELTSLVDVVVLDP